MNEDLQGIINMLERARELICQNRPNEAGTIIYEAQGLTQFLKDNKTT
jgi:hypothetical protein